MITAGPLPGVTKSSLRATVNSSGANAQVEVKHEEVSSESITTDVRVNSDGFSGLSHLSFEMEGDKIRAMRIGD